MGGVETTPRPLLL